MAYHAYWMGDVWRQYDLAQFQRLLFFSLTPDQDGAIREHNGWPQQWNELRQKAAQAQRPVDPVLAILGLDLFHAVFSQQQARARLLAECVALARAADGLHLDVEIFEAASHEDVQSYQEFLAQLRAALDTPPKKFLSVFAPADGNLYTPKELAYFDAVIAQGYDVHWAEAPNAGPVALLKGDSAAAWQPAAARLQAVGVERGRVYFSTPLYGYEWPVESGKPRAPSRGKARTITYAPVSADQLPDIRINALSRVLQAGVHRETASAAPWYTVLDADGWWQGWFDDAVSLGPRLDFVRDGHFGGVAFFVLGYDGGALLEVARAAFRVPVPAASGVPPPVNPQ